MMVMVAKQAQEPTSQPTAAQDIYTLPDKDPRFPFSLMRFRIVSGIFHDPRSRITPRRFCWSCCCCGGGCKLGLKLRGGGWVGEKLTKTVGWRILMILMNCVWVLLCCCFPACSKGNRNQIEPPTTSFLRILPILCIIIDYSDSIHLSIYSWTHPKSVLVQAVHVHRYKCTCIPVAVYSIYSRANPDSCCAFYLVAAVNVVHSYRWASGHQ